MGLSMAASVYSLIGVVLLGLDPTSQLTGPRLLVFVGASLVGTLGFGVAFGPFSSLWPLVTISSGWAWLFTKVVTESDEPDG